ncbi:MAG TPA: alpha/beta fold hydrolase [Vicinamibacterales bacterium]|nr:alpha/beta fold hydrolase [Vicinamibacterales bacterium]
MNWLIEPGSSATFAASPRRIAFVPGAAGAGAFWSPIVQRLPADWLAEALDLPGLGTIPARADVGSYDDLAEYVHEKIARPTVLVAQSMGVYIALALALRHPDSITHLVLVAATGGVNMAVHGAAEWRADYAANYPHAARWACALVPDLTERLGDLKIPVLLIWPTRDALSPIGVGHTIAAHVPRASLVSFESEDHWVVHQFPDHVAAAIESFVERES